MPCLRTAERQQSNQLKPETSETMTQLKEGKSCLVKRSAHALQVGLATSLRYNTALTRWRPDAVGQRLSPSPSQSGESQSWWILPLFLLWNRFHKRNSVARIHETAEWIPTTFLLINHVDKQGLPWKSMETRGKYVSPTLDYSNGPHTVQAVSMDWFHLYLGSEVILRTQKVKKWRSREPRRPGNTVEYVNTQDKVRKGRDWINVQGQPFILCKCCWQTPWAVILVITGAIYLPWKKMCY